jgi:hypothetical protein
MIMWMVAASRLDGVCGGGSGGAGECGQVSAGAGERRREKVYK